MNAVVKPEAAGPIVSARGIVNRFGSQRVHDGIDLDVMPGEILGIAGGSGSGKSVLLKTLVGLHRPTAGEVLLDGRPVGAINGAERASLLGVLFQQGALFSSLTVIENIALPIGLHQEVPVAEREAIAAKKLQMTGLPADAGPKFASQLSGGMVKRAAFARALALDPRILFLDEPTSGLDPLSATGIDALIEKLNREHGITMVMVTHDLNTLLTICDRVAMLVEGRMVCDTVENLMHQDDPWIHELLHSPRAQAAAATRQRRPHGIR